MDSEFWIPVDGELGHCRFHNIEACTKDFQSQSTQEVYKLKHFNKSVLTSYSMFVECSILELHLYIAAMEYQGGPHMWIPSNCWKRKSYLLRWGQVVCLMVLIMLILLLLLSRVLLYLNIDECQQSGCTKICLFNFGW